MDFLTIESEKEYFGVTAFMEWVWSGYLSDCTE